MRWAHNFGVTMTQAKNFTSSQPAQPAKQISQRHATSFLFLGASHSHLEHFFHLWVNPSHALGEQDNRGNSVIAKASLHSVGEESTTKLISRAAAFHKHWSAFVVRHETLRIIQQLVP